MATKLPANLDIINPDLIQSAGSHRMFQIAIQQDNRYVRAGEHADDFLVDAGRIRTIIHGMKHNAGNTVLNELHRKLLKPIADLIGGIRLFVGKENKPIMFLTNRGYLMADCRKYLDLRQRGNNQANLPGCALPGDNRTPSLYTRYQALMSKFLYGPLYGRPGQTKPS